MVTVTIGESTQVFSDSRDIDEMWINQQLSRQRKDGVVCTRVKIEKDGQPILSIVGANCPKFGGGGNSFTDQQNAIYELWQELGLEVPDFASGRLIAFLKRVFKLL